MSYAIFENGVAGSCACATYQIRRFYGGEGGSSTCLPHGEAFARHIKVINEGIPEHGGAYGNLCYFCYLKVGKSDDNNSEA
jgi:hypothetical protein